MKIKYDALLLLSGGKDSCSLAFRLKKKGMNVLAFTNDVGFMSDIAKENIKKVIDILDMDYIMTKPKPKTHKTIIDNYFSDSTQRMADVCFACSLITQQMAFQIAQAFGINKIVAGFTKYYAKASGLNASPTQRIGDIDFCNPYYEEYDLKEIKKLLKEYGIETDPIKTNCKFIKRIIDTHTKRFGENPLKKEFDLLLNNGQITKEEYNKFLKEE